MGKALVDRIEQILQYHLDAATRQFGLMGHDAQIDVPDEVARFVPATVEELISRIDALSGALQRHRERNADRT